MQETPVEQAYPIMEHFEMASDENQNVNMQSMAVQSVQSVKEGE